jgi:predicted deacylase
VHPDITDMVKKGDRIATQTDMFGDKIQEYFAPEDGIVIGRSVSPVNQTGGRILHLGLI